MKPVIIILLCLPAMARAQSGDSVKVAKTLKELLQICKTVNFGDPKVGSTGTFYKAAPYIVYRGEDQQRKWKTMADYKKAEDKKGVDEVCYRINSTVNQDSNYRIIKYATEKESEGTWHVLTVSYLKKGKTKTAIFAFLRIGGRYGLGDID